MLKKIMAEDIIFGPKLSFMAVGKTPFENVVIRKAATDISVFDQTACASPHTIFVEEGGKVNPKEFAERIQKIKLIVLALRLDVKRSIDKTH